MQQKKKPSRFTDTTLATNLKSLAEEGRFIKSAHSALLTAEKITEKELDIEWNRITAD